MKKLKEKKSIAVVVRRIFVVLSVFCVLVWSALYAVNYMIGEGDENSSQDFAGGADTTLKEKKEVINALVVGVNDGLTDTIMYVKYNVKTGKIAIMSIPRDTYITSDYSVGHKLNSIYRGKNIIPLVEQVESLIGVKIDYYLVFKADMLISMVDAIGGVEVDVEMDMKYDDPTQNLHIDIKKGNQILDGKNAEGFVRYRHGNNGTGGYPMGDLDRTEVQQYFIKQFAKSALSVKNISKIPDLIDIAHKNTNTNLTTREALRYVTDIANIDINGIYSTTAPGAAKYIDNVSYYLLDKEKTKEVIENNFNI